MKDMLDDLPTLARVATVVGVPSIIALYLVWVLSGGVATAAQMDEHMRGQDTQVKLLRIICSQIARSESALIECSK